MRPRSTISTRCSTPGAFPSSKPRRRAARASRRRSRSRPSSSSRSWPPSTGTTEGRGPRNRSNARLPSRPSPRRLLPHHRRRPLRSCRLPVRPRRLRHHHCRLPVRPRHHHRPGRRLLHSRRLGPLPRRRPRSLRTTICSTRSEAREALPLHPAFPSTTNSISDPRLDRNHPDSGIPSTRSAPFRRLLRPPIRSDPSFLSIRSGRLPGQPLRGPRANSNWTSDRPLRLRPAPGIHSDQPWTRPSRLHPRQASPRPSTTPSARRLDLPERRRRGHPPPRPSIP
jgi:hypothetical protein